VVTSAETIEAERRHAATLARLAVRSGLPFGLFASLREFLRVEAVGLFGAEIWRNAGTEGFRALGELER
jgi:hypothetical protein